MRPLHFALIAVPAALLIAAGREATSSRRTATSYGTPVPLGAGTARTFLTMDGGRPVELGIAVTEAAMTGLPANDHSLPGVMTMPDGHAMFEHSLTFPADNPTPFRHAVLNWNPAGHEPPGVYDKPHFDFHFYMIDEAERHAIVPDDPGFDEKAERHPKADELPAGYVPTPAVPMMGTHWLDPAAPELNRGTFTQTFIAGSWDGRATFLEPMITKAFLESRPDFTARIPVVRSHAEPGWYPQAYAIRWNADSREWHITLRDFARR